MGQDERVDVLYDFLYRDARRLASYYAQLFRGHLISREESSSDKSTVETSGKAEVLGVGGALKSLGETGMATKKIIDPHDLIPIDALARLIEQRWIKELKDGQHGELVLCQGTLALMDRTVTELATSMKQELAEQFTAGQPQPASKKERQKQERVVNMLLGILENLRIPSAFWLRTKDTTQVVGTINEDGLSEPIASFYFKHGA